MYSATVSSLCSTWLRVFQITPQTIRRDINLLAEMNLLQRYQGDVCLPSSAENIAYGARLGLVLERKASHSCAGGRVYS